MTARRVGAKLPSKPCYDCLDEAIANRGPIIDSPR
jgi:hypothetical protein